MDNLKSAWFFLELMIRKPHGDLPSTVLSDETMTMETQETYLRAILATVARQTFSPSFILESIPGEKQRQAFNLCDGTRSQTDIQKELGLDKGSFSKTLSRWVDLGIAIRVGIGREMKPMHVYPISESDVKKAREKGADGG